MKERGLDIQGAMDYAGELVRGRIDLYTSTKASLPSWGSRVDADVMKYLQVCEDWMTGGFYWSLESKRVSRILIRSLLLYLPFGLVLCRSGQPSEEDALRRDPAEGGGTSRADQHPRS